MTLQVDRGRWLWGLGLGGLAALLGLLAGLDPKLAIAGSIALAFLLLTIADLRAGLAIFAVVSFLGLTSVASGVGLAKLAGFALAISWLAKVATSERDERQFWDDFPAFSFLLIAFFGWICLSLIWAGSTSAVSSSAMRYLLGMAVIPIVFTVLKRLRDVRVVMGAFVIGSVVSAAYGLVTAAPNAGSGEIERLAGTVGDPNLLASVLVVGMILGVAVALTLPRGSIARLTAATGALLCLLGVVDTFSRGGLLSLAMALIVAPFFARRKAAAICGGLIVVIAIATYFLAFAPQDARDRLSAENGGSGRTDIWTVGWRMVEAHPVVGVGAGNFPSASVHYVLEPGTLNNKRDLINEPAVAHNMYLQVLAELGVIGLAMFVAILTASVGAAIAAFRRFKRLGDQPMAILASAIAISLASILGSYYFLSEEYSKQMWLLLAFGPALLAIARARERREDPA
jgi:O-antigen ligase